LARAIKGHGKLKEGNRDVNETRLEREAEICIVIGNSNPAKKLSGYT
jgi:hypothetical protein